MKTAIQTQRFPNRIDAERHLAEQGFHFQGAPSRWRKTMDRMVRYADVVVQNGVAIVMYTEASERMPPDASGGDNVWHLATVSPARKGR
ncbi:MAG TPA: hypothetical protein VD978_13345 [Azospirillum sp.]|nr:hypothetical protein [Azospirillum sp.]